MAITTGTGSSFFRSINNADNNASSANERRTNFEAAMGSARAANPRQADLAGTPNLENRAATASTRAANPGQADRAGTPPPDPIVTYTAPAPDIPPRPAHDTSEEAAITAALEGGMGSFINESQATRDRAETEVAVTTAALEGGMGSFVNESRALHDRAHAEAQAPSPDFFDPRFPLNSATDGQDRPPSVFNPPAFGSYPTIEPTHDEAVASASEGGMASVINASQAEAAFSPAIGFVSSFGPGNLVNESASNELTAENAEVAAERARRQSPVFVYDPFADGQGILDTTSPTPEPRITWQSDRHWLNDNTRGFDGSSLDADPRTNGIDDPYGVIHIDGYGDLPIGVPSTEQYTGYIDGQVARVDSNAIIDHDDWTTVEIIGSNSELRNPSGSERGVAFILGLTGGPAIPYRSVRPEVYNQARIDERGNIFLNDGLYFAPQGSQVPSDFTPPTIGTGANGLPVPNPEFNAASGGVQLTQNATTGFGNMLAIDDAGHALTQVHVQENSDGERRAVIQRVTIGSVGGGPIFAHSHYLTTDPSSGDLLDLNPVMYPDVRVSWSGTGPAPEDDRIIESLHFSEAEVLNPVGESVDDAPVVNEPSTSGHVPAPVDPGGPTHDGGSVFDNNSNVNNAGIPG